MTSSRPSSRGVAGGPSPRAGTAPGGCRGRPQGQHCLPASLPVDGLEDTWVRGWEEEGIYRFDRTATRDRAFPMGWDDNGLPTERRVQNHFGVRCDPAPPYEGLSGLLGPQNQQKWQKSRAWQNPQNSSNQHRSQLTQPSARQQGKARPVPVSRRAFIELCEQFAAADEQEFEEVWRRPSQCSTCSPQATLYTIADGYTSRIDLCTRWSAVPAGPLYPLIRQLRSRIFRCRPTLMISSTDPPLRRDPCLR